MNVIQNALIGNPFSTPVGSKIEQATDGSLASENWALNMEICDIINETEDGPKDAIRAIKKRLSQSAGKNYTIVMYTLTILETCVKNCGKRFHILACSKDFVQELVKLLSPKNDPPTAVQEKVLSLIQSWASAFQADQDLLGVNVVYKDLLAKGIEFPPTDLDSLAPIHTPKKSVSTMEAPSQTRPIRPASVPSPSASPLPPLESPTGGILTPEQRAKLQSELDVVQSNMNVLGELLSEVKPGQEERDELELLQELYSVCHQMQQRLVELISRITNDTLTEELLRINDDMNNLFLRYSRWEKNRGSHGHSASASEVVAKAIPPTSAVKPTLKNDDSLIDLDDDDVADTVKKLGLGDSLNGKGTDEFDMFAQSRNVTYESSKISGSSYKDNINPNQISGGLSSVTQGQLAEGGAEESVTSSDFERFLAERAAAAENLPTVSAATGSNNPSALKKDNKKKDENLLAL
ncbi:TOM1-like protein 2 isoform X2 [Anthonomus grandis grandis]|uniref:TOM1-like protein 2 isoform X2 n=1 Tax=Anthonomus grandis grandis TaxID=2921223 RepID=UPI0021656FD1|nr:TOM1-like protein 2 isoform X2 [Anthonomus grandis grandis]